MNKFFLYKLLAVLLGVMLICNASLAKSAVKEGLELCASAVIPALFPFAAVTGFLFFDGRGIGVPKVVTFLLKKFLGIPKELCPAFLFGIFAGFPMGGTAVSLALKNRICTKREAEYVLCLASLPSPAFIIGFAGQSISGSLRGGVFMLMALFISILPVSILLRLTVFADKRAIPLCDAHKKEAENAVITKKPSAIQAFTFAVKNAGVSMLTVCSFVVFFTVISRFLCGGKAESYSFLDVATTGMLEMTSGVGLISKTGLHELHATLMCLVTLGFGGISAIFQTISVFGEGEISFVPFFISRIYFAFFSFLSGILMMIFLPVTAPVWNPLKALLPQYALGGSQPYFSAAYAFAASITTALALLCAGKAVMRRIR